MIVACAAIPDESNTDSTETREYTNISVTVQDCAYRYWYASTCHYAADITVYNKDYDLTETFHFSGYEALQFQNCKNGDELLAEMVIYKNNTGTKRQINDLII